MDFNKKKNISDSIFREYDIRGKVGEELPLEGVYDLGRAIAYYFKKQDSTIQTIAIGMDGRLHSPQIKEHLCNALIDSGINVTFLGLCTSPALYFALHNLPVDGGIMITASHNPKEYNGFKICCGKKMIHGDKIRELRDVFKAKKCLASEKSGIYSEYNIVEAYTDWLAEHFNHLKDMDLSVVADCGNAVGGAVMPILVKKMGWKHVALLYETVDGNYPNHTADPVIEENMRDVQKTLKETDVQLGIGFDGDGDRMGAMTKGGYLVPGDQLLALFAQDILQHHPGAAVAFDIKASTVLIETLKKLGADLAMSKTGHAFIKEAMHKYNAVLGGELSCHFFFNDRYFGYDDGIYAAMRLFELIIKTGKSLQELLAQFPVTCSSREIRMSFPHDKIQPAIEDLKKYFQNRPEANVITIDGIRASMPYGWGIVRASNTQPVLSLRFEANSAEDLKHIKEDFAEVLADYVDQNVLRKDLF